MARLAFKPDSSFFRKIAIGAVGARAVAADLTRYGHDVTELERGSTDTKLWRDVKRKRVRIPDLVCQRCGLRIESRAKTKPELSMSHSPTDQARAWDFGMVHGDCIAFPVCQPAKERYWSCGRLRASDSYWHERNWVRWVPKSHINYFFVSTLRSTPHSRNTTKGVTEGSETSIAWEATFSTRTGLVEAVGPSNVTIRRDSDGRRYTWRIRDGLRICVSAHDTVRENQVIASAPEPITGDALHCAGSIPSGYISQLLNSRERTQRFTGIKLARLLRDSTYEEPVTELLNDPEEDVYIRLEGASYLVSLCGQSARALFQPFCHHIDEQTRLEAVIAMGEASTTEAVELLCKILDAGTEPYFLRSAAAWSLSRRGTDLALERLVQAFSDIDLDIREDALEAIVAIGGPAIPVLLEGLRSGDAAIAAGCAETLRQQGHLPDAYLAELTNELRSAKPSQWAVWLAGHLPRDEVSASIAGLQESAPHLHYAISLLWSFVESWIARRWELQPRPEAESVDDVSS